MNLPRSLLACLLSVLFIAVGAGPVAAADPPAAAEVKQVPAGPAEGKSLDGDVQALKKEVIDLNKDLFVLEEELLFPANTQVAVFVSLDVGTYFQLDSVQLKVDNKEVSNYLYTEREVDAWARLDDQMLPVRSTSQAKM